MVTIEENNAARASGEQPHREVSPTLAMIMNHHPVNPFPMRPCSQRPTPFQIALFQITGAETSETGMVNQTLHIHPAPGRQAKDRSCNSTRQLTSSRDALHRRGQNKQLT